MTELIVISTQMDLAAHYAKATGKQYTQKNIDAINFFFDLRTREITAYSEIDVNRGNGIKENIRTGVYQIPPTNLMIYRTTIVSSGQIKESQPKGFDFADLQKRISDLVSITSTDEDDFYLNDFIEHLFRCIRL